MTPQEINVAIVEVCGTGDPHWFCPICEQQVSPEMVTFHETHQACGGMCTWRTSPDYINDLNACAEMRKCVPEGKRMEYALTLSAICGRQAKYTAWAWSKANASAEQHCETFLRVMGIWSEE